MQLITRNQIKWPTFRNCSVFQTSLGSEQSESWLASRPRQTSFRSIFNFITPNTYLPSYITNETMIPPHPLRHNKRVTLIFSYCNNKRSTNPLSSDAGQLLGCGVAALQGGMVCSRNKPTRPSLGWSKHVMRCPRMINMVLRCRINGPFLRPDLSLA
jgi:hypothetical protein